MTPEQINDALLQDWVNELRASGGEWVKKYGGPLLQQMFPPGYREWLLRFHQTLKPKRYLEIGVSTGNTLILAQEGTQVIGVDPEPKLEDRGKPDAGFADPKDFLIFKMTSDEFFERVSVQNVDMTFVDGLHLFENALADVLNAASVTRIGGTILMHDVVPANAEMASRENPGDGHPWTGDVWKVIPWLQAFRPRWKLELIDCTPSGLLVITGTEPDNFVVKNVRIGPAQSFPRDDDIANMTYADYRIPVELIVPQGSGPKVLDHK